MEHPELHARFAGERLRDDHSGLPEPNEPAVRHAAEPVTIRPLREVDLEAVRRLAELEDRPVPPGPLLLAEVGGTVEAALALEGGETLADPFASTGQAVELLRVRAEQLRAA